MKRETMPGLGGVALTRIRRCVVTAGFLMAGAVVGLGSKAFAADSPGRPVRILVEAETAQAGQTNMIAGKWYVKKMPGASGGKVLAAHGYGVPESSRIAVGIPHAGTYRVWVRYYKKNTDSLRLQVLFRDEGGEELAFHFCDWAPLPHMAAMTETPYVKPATWAGAQTNSVWEAFDAAFERPVTAGLSFSPAYAIDCVLVTDDTAFNPASVDMAPLSSSTSTGVVSLPSAPSGFIWSAGLPANVAFFSAIKNPSDRFYAGLINCGSYFMDTARQVRMGFNRDHARPDSTNSGVLGMANVECYDGGSELAKAYPAPEGRFVNSDGQTGTVFSYHFPPVVESSAKQVEANVKKWMAESDDTVGWWRISVEDGGYLDYSPYAVAAFRKWVAAKHGTVAQLNARWGTSYKDFAEIVPPAKLENGRSAWLEFREFSGHSYVEAVSRQLPIIRKTDPKQRPCFGANSGVDTFSPYFSAFRPIDYEEFIRVALAGERYVAWDTYCADDQLACETELLSSLSEGRKVMVQEWSNHAVDPRIAARSYWTYVSKGVAGIHLFMFQEGFLDASYPKWALLSHDRSPKAKLAAYSDAAQEVHRLEPLLMAARYTHAVKPVAMYWSRIDLSVEPPDESLYGCALDSPFHVYRTLRGLGYAVRWITPRQIAAGELDRVSAVVLAGTRFIPQAAAVKLEGWVKAGGAVIGDNWPGMYDEYGQPQATLTPLFGVRAPTAPQKSQASTLALQQSVQGYGEVTDAAVVRKNIFQKIEEIAQQPGATHPVARALGDFMVSGIGLEPVECFAGHVVGMTHSGRPGFVLNEYGKGKTLYSSILLGTIYESGGTRYEWDTTHAGLSYGRVLDAFLKYAGVQPSSAVEGLTPRVRAKLRVESPLVTPDGNVVIGLTSLNDDVVRPFDLQVELPPGARGPFVRVFVVTQGSRWLQPVEAKVNGSQLALHMPSFDTHAAIVALKDFTPLVSLELKGVRRGVAGLALIDTHQTFEVEVTVYNPSARKLAAGEVSLAIPAGWLQSADKQALAALRPGAEARCSFRLRAPALAAATRINPLVAHYRSGTIDSTPATEMVWWGGMPR